MSRFPKASPNSPHVFLRNVAGPLYEQMQDTLESIVEAEGIRLNIGWGEVTRSIEVLCTLRSEHNTGIWIAEESITDDTAEMVKGVVERVRLAGPTLRKALVDDAAEHELAHGGQRMIDMCNFLVMLVGDHADDATCERLGLQLLERVKIERAGKDVVG